jgi:hypothetical protein
VGGAGAVVAVVDVVVVVVEVGDVVVVVDGDVDVVVVVSGERAALDDAQALNTNSTGRRRRTLIG